MLRHTKPETGRARQFHRGIEGIRGGGVDARRYERVTFFCEVELTARPYCDTVLAYTCDISLGGVKLASPVTLPMSATVTLGFSLMNRAGERDIENVTGRVVRCQSDVDTTYLGIEFAAPLNEETNPLLTKRLMNI